METVIKRGHCAYCKTAIRVVLSQGPHPKTKARFCLNRGAQLWTVCECGNKLRYEDVECSRRGRANPIYLGNDPDLFADGVER